MMYLVTKKNAYKHNRKPPHFNIHSLMLVSYLIQSFKYNINRPSSSLHTVTIVLFIFPHRHGIKVHLFFKIQ
uniref:Uncharacterized protein n=1 Tax=Pararge aegeria TaxID=116150 RepID=S4PTG0_9NEOP